MKTKAQQIAIIDRAYLSIPVIEHQFTNLRAMLFEECKAAEKQHRRGHPAPRGFSVGAAARYFTVKYLRHFALDPGRIPTIKDYLSVRRELFTAASIYFNAQDEITEWAESVDPEFDAIDYCKLMRD